MKERTSGGWVWSPRPTRPRELRDVARLLITWEPRAAIEPYVVLPGAFKVPESHHVILGSQTLYHHIWDMDPAHSRPSAPAQPLARPAPYLFMLDILLEHARGPVTGFKSPLPSPLPTAPPPMSS